MHLVDLFVFLPCLFFCSKWQRCFSLFPVPSPPCRPSCRGIWLARVECSHCASEFSLPHSPSPSVSLSLFGALPSRSLLSVVRDFNLNIWLTDLSGIRRCMRQRWAQRATASHWTAPVLGERERQRERQPKLIEKNYHKIIINLKSLLGCCWWSMLIN